MPTPRDAFARFVGGVLKQMRADGMTIADVVKATGVSKTTLHRWTTGDWTTEPRANQVWDFCVGLGIPPDAAGECLGWTSAPLSGLDGPLHQIQQALANPRVSEADKQTIRAALRLASDVVARATETEKMEAV